MDCLQLQNILHMILRQLFANWGRKISHLDYLRQNDGSEDLLQVTWQGQG